MSAAETTVAPSSTQPTTAKRRRRGFQLTLRTLLIATLILSIPLAGFAWRLQRARYQAKAVATIWARGGGICYDNAGLTRMRGYWVASTGHRTLVPRSLITILGVDFFFGVRGICLEEIPKGSARDSDVINDCLAQLSRSEYLFVGKGWKTGELTASIHKMRRLVELRIDAGGLENDHMMVLGRCENLHSLWIGGDNNEFDDEGIKALTALKNLRSLEVRNSQITDQGIVQLAEACDLRTLDIRGNARITDAGIAQIAALRPNCEITK